MLLQLLLVMILNMMLLIVVLLSVLTIIIESSIIILTILLIHIAGTMRHRIMILSEVRTTQISFKLIFVIIIFVLILIVLFNNEAIHAWSISLIWQTIAAMLLVCW